MKKNIKIYLCFFIGLLLVSILSPIEIDGIWEYGFSYNVSNGLIPYKDFNMVVGPLYSIIFSLPMTIFGNYFFLFELMHIILYSFIFTGLYNRFGKNSIFILLLYSSCLTMFGYNLFCVMMMLTILLLLDSKFKYKQIFIGIIIGSILITKHNIGLFLLLVYIYDNRKNLLNLLSVLIPVVPTILYLIINNALYGYIDFCFLGISKFLNNLVFEFISIIPYLFFMIPVIKDFIKKRTIQLAYILAFQIIVFPLLDQWHVIPALIPIMYYLFTTKNIKIQFFMKYFTVIGFFVIVIINPIFECKFITGNNYLKFQRIRNGVDKYIFEYSNYIDSLDSKNIYLLIEQAYMIKLYRNEKIGFYDLLNKGNLGSDENKYIDIMSKNCDNKKCLFIISDGYCQYTDIFKNYVIDNYYYVDTLPNGDKVYTSVEVKMGE